MQRLSPPEIPCSHDRILEASLHLSVYLSLLLECDFVDLVQGLAFEGRRHLFEVEELVVGVEAQSLHCEAGVIQWGPSDRLVDSRFQCRERAIEVLGSEQHHLGRPEWRILVDLVDPAGLPVPAGLLFEGCDFPRC